MLVVVKSTVTVTHGDDDPLAIVGGNIGDAVASEIADDRGAELSLAEWHGGYGSQRADLIAENDRKAAWATAIEWGTDGHIEYAIAVVVGDVESISWLASAGSDADIIGELHVVTMQ